MLSQEMLWLHNGQLRDNVRRSHIRASPLPSVRTRAINRHKEFEDDRNWSNIARYSPSCLDLTIVLGHKAPSVQMLVFSPSTRLSHFLGVAPVWQPSDCSACIFSLSACYQNVLLINNCPALVQPLDCEHGAAAYLGQVVRPEPHIDVVLSECRRCRCQIDHQSC